MEEEFLDPNFDPNSLTIARLKSALADAGVTLPMRQEKKPFYVDLFRTHISARADELLSARQHVRPSAAGIMAVSKNGSPRGTLSERDEPEVRLAS
jgi:hypothetical protein